MIPIYPIISSTTNGAKHGATKWEKRVLRSLSYSLSSKLSGSWLSYGYLPSKPPGRLGRMECSDNIKQIGIAELVSRPISVR